MSKVLEKIKVRKAEAKDFNDLLSLINALADYEKLERPNLEARSRLKKDIFGDPPKIFVYLAGIDDKIVGYAIIFYTYSSFLALPTLYLEDIFVLPEYRSKGIGKALFMRCSKLALENNCGRMEWQVLNWNEIAIDFYSKIGAKQLQEWLQYRLTKKELKELVSP